MLVGSKHQLQNEAQDKRKGPGMLTALCSVSKNKNFHHPLAEREERDKEQGTSKRIHPPTTRLHCACLPQRTYDSDSGAPQAAPAVACRAAAHWHTEIGMPPPPGASRAAIGNA